MLLYRIDVVPKKVNFKHDHQMILVQSKKKKKKKRSKIKKESEEDNGVGKVKR